MNHSGNNKPPYLVLVFFRWFCHPEFREDIEGDLLERFHNRITKLGVRKAKWLFLKDVLLLFRVGILRDLKGEIQNKFLNTKSINWFKLTVVNLLLILAIILPFLPGPPNNLVIGLSTLAQSTGFFGLLLVPIGIIWAILEIRKVTSTNSATPSWRAPFYLAIIALVIVTAFCLLVLIAVVANWDVFTGLPVLIISALGMKGAIRGIKKLRKPSTKQLNPLPFYLLTIPLIALVTRTHLVEPVSDFSRSFAIKRCEALIASIEDFKNKEGQYPESIDYVEGRYLEKIPSPFIMGIQNFRYNKINDQYSLSFSQWLEIGSLEQIVLYDRNNLRNNLKGDFAKYDYRFDLCRVKGAFASYDAGHNYWRYYQVD